jgi:hypothetical protein
MLSDSDDFPPPRLDMSGLNDFHEVESTPASLRVLIKVYETGKGVHKPS